MESLLDALSALWGTPTRTARFGKGSDQYRLAKWTDLVQDGRVVYVTEPRDGNGAGLALALKSGRDQIAADLTWTQRAVDQETDKTTAGQAFNVERPLWDGTDMRVLQLQSPVDSLIVEFNNRHTEFRTCHLLQVFPLYLSETRLDDAEQSAFSTWLLSDDRYCDPDRTAWNS